MEIKKIQLLSALLAAALLVGCASTDTSDDDAAAAAAAEQAAAEKAAMEAAEAEAAAKAAEAAANLQTVFYFDFDQATLSADTRAALDAQVAVLKDSNAKVRLEGHADERGTREYNMALGERRANAIANYLIINGVARYRVETVSYGEERPVASGSGDSAWSQNRRVELK
ncbi:peptidoglycan-associated lipoprotein Pal [Oceanicoccus sagamiensis]|nr:peptidoglycan-associated lipoprotein Pal [Oceanicoccus sagamiensis]